MYEGEPMDVYLERVLDLLERSRRSGIVRSDDEVIKKLLGSLSWSVDGVAPLLEEIMNLKDMTLINMLDLFGDHPETMPNMLKGFYVSLKKAKSEQMWCGLCKKYNHNQEDCYGKERKRRSKEIQRSVPSMWRKRALCKRLQLEESAKER